MSRENDLVKLINEGMTAEGILSNPLFAASFNSIRGKIISEFSATKFDDKEKREYLHRLLNNVDSIERFYETVLQNGKIAEQDLDDLTNDKGGL